MNKKIFFTFIISMAGFYLILQVLFGVLSERQKFIDNQQTNIILENVQNQFRNFLNLPHSLAAIGASYLSTGDIKNMEYGNFSEEVLNLNKEMIALNLVNVEGKIIRIYPEHTNQGALGKVSQNYQNLMNSYKRGEKYWFSPPFRLFQGPLGFVLYVPIKNGKKLIGWFATVIDSQLFFKKFQLEDFLKSYNLVIRDAKTNQAYFANAVISEDAPQIYQEHTKIYGKDFIFQSWRKNAVIDLLIPWYSSFIIAFLLSTLLALLMRFNEQKKKAKNQLHDIRVLLKLSAKEALHGLIDGQTTGSQDISYITNLIEQIDLLQSMASSTDGLLYEDQSFIELLEEQLEGYQEIIAKKDIKVLYRSESLKSLMISANGSLIQNSVISNILTHSIIYAQKGSRLEIEDASTEESNIICFHTVQVQSEKARTAFQVDRRLEVAKKALQIYRGQLYLQNDLSEGMIIRIIIPT